ncbi:MAG: PBP1A family penicillin-binding protein [Clostridiales bacterium]|nr:PBP1A family penicillin-binding protein [Clostridiales bacterium]
MSGKKKKRKKHRAFWLFVKLQFILFLVVVAGVAYSLFGSYGKDVQAMKDKAYRTVRDSTEETFRGSQTSIVYASDKSVIATMKSEKESYYLPIEEIPTEAITAMVSIEDKKFYRHNGVDYRALLRAGISMLKHGRITQGGSTITMQLARNVFISQERTWQRKVEEMFLAWNLEEAYTKDQIMEFYMNNIYFGNGYYGLQSASRGYFNSDANELSLSQLAFLCAIPNNPTLYDPVTSMENTLARRDRILENMRKDGKISKTDYAAAVVEPIVLERPSEPGKNDYVETYAYYCAARALMEKENFHFLYQFDSEEQRRDYEERYSSLYEACLRKLYYGGYRIYTSVDLTLQDQLQTSINERLEEFTDVNEEGVYTMQAAAVCIDNGSGHVKAIVGGRSQGLAGYTLNRAYQSYRQPGSVIKPLIVYTPAFERNYTPETIVVDEPIEDGPQNANGRYLGALTVREAVERSTNTVAWKLYEELTPARGLSFLEEMNFSRLDKEDYRPATSLGGFTNGVSPLEIAAAYAALENDGMYRMPTCIERILDADGNEIYVGTQTEKQIYRQNAARMMTDVLTGVLKKGTGKGLGLKDIPCAGKTGTTNENKDGWFVGYTRYYTTSVWVGYDMPKAMDGLTGSTYPGLIWQSFMTQAHEGVDPLDFLPYAKLPEESLQKEEDKEIGQEELWEDAVEEPEENGAQQPQENEVQQLQENEVQQPQSP